MHLTLAGGAMKVDRMHHLCCQNCKERERDTQTSLLSLSGEGVCCWAMASSRLWITLLLSRRRCLYELRRAFIFRRCCTRCLRSCMRYCSACCCSCCRCEYCSRKLSRWDITATRGGSNTCRSSYERSQVNILILFINYYLHIMFAIPGLRYLFSRFSVDTGNFPLLRFLFEGQEGRQRCLRRDSVTFISVAIFITERQFIALTAAAAAWDVRWPSGLCEHDDDELYLNDNQETRCSTITLSFPVPKPKRDYQSKTILMIYTLNNYYFIYIILRHLKIQRLKHGLNKATTFTYTANTINIIKCKYN